MSNKSSRSVTASSVTGNLKNLTLGLVVSTAITGVAAHGADSNAASDEAKTSVARAVIESIAVNRTSSNDPAETSGGEMSARRIFLARAQEMMEADKREVDEVAARLKELIRARYEAEAENAQSLVIIRELQEKIAEYEALLDEANARQQALGAEKDTLQQRLNLVRDERDNALNDLGLVDSRLQDNLGALQQLQLAGDAADKELAFRKQRIADLNDQINKLTGQRDNALANSDALERKLIDNQHELDKVKNQLVHARDNLKQVVSEKDLAKDALATKQAILNERENKLARLDGLMSEKQDALGILERQLGTNNQTVRDLEAIVDSLRKDRDDVQTQLLESEDKLAGVETLVDEKTKQLASFGEQVENLNQQHTDALDQINALNQQHTDALDQIKALKQKRTDALDQIKILKQKLANTEGLANGLTTERDKLANKLSAFEKKAIDIGESLAEEQKGHTQTRTNLLALQSEADDLQKTIELLTGEKAGLIDETIELKATRTQVEEQLKVTQKELDNRGNELDAALSSISTLNKRIADLSKERDMLTAKVDELGGDLVALESGMNKSTLEYNKLLSGKDREIKGLTSRIAELSEAGKQLKLEKDKGVRDIKALGGNIDKLTVSRDEALTEVDRLGSVNEKLLTDLLDAGKQYDDLRAATEAQLADLEKELMELTESRASQQEQIVQLEQLNAELGDKLQSGREKLDVVSADSAAQILALNEQIDALLSKEKLYKSNMLETGEKLQEMLGQNNALSAELSAGRDMNLQLTQDISGLKNELGNYDAELNAANQKLAEMMKAQRLAEAERDRIAAEAEALRVSLTDELNKARLEHITVQKARADNSIPITLGNADFFETGSAELTKEGGEKLTQIAQIIQDHHDRRIVVEGHTDNVPIGPKLISRFASNWELSVARAAVAVRHMQKHTDIDPRNLSAAGYGEFKPVGDNSTEEGKQLNRRVEVVLYPRESKFKNLDDITNLTAIEE